MKVHYNKELVVARKGRKGFFVSNTVDDFTSVVDIRIPRIINDLYQAVTTLSGYVGEKSPIRLTIGKTKNITNRINVNADLDNLVIKFADCPQLIVDYKGTGIDILRTTLVDNKNNRYEAVVSQCGYFCILRRIQVHTTVFRHEEAKSAIVVSMVPQQPAKRAELTEPFYASG